MLGLLLLVLVALLVWRWWRNTRIPENFPPGPLGLPLVGNLGVISAGDIVRGFEGLHSQYGDIASVNLGPQKRSVVVGDYEALKDAFRDDAFAARPKAFQWFNAYTRHGNGEDARGLFFSSGSEWNEQRRFTIRQLREFGFGKSSMEALIQEEVADLLRIIDKDQGHEFSVLNSLNISVVNALWTMISGKRFALDDQGLLDIVRKISKLTTGSGAKDLVFIFPFTRFIMPELSGWKNSLATIKDVISFIRPCIDEHQKNHNQSEEPKDYIDVFLNKVKESESDPSSSFHKTLGLYNLEAGLLDMLIAGTDTTSTALSWAILYVVYHEDIQRKVQSELESVLSSDLPTLEDRARLPFTEAVLLETLRLASIAPVGAPHSTTRDGVKLGPYTLPADTTVFTNLYRIMRNPRDFPDPEAFKPERFINEKGEFVRHEKVVAFSTGKRDCLGKTLAQTQLFLFFTAILQRFSIKAVGDVTLEAQAGLLRSPKPFKVVFKMRKS